jgi:hypothetical protein
MSGCGTHFRTPSSKGFVPGVGICRDRLAGTADTGNVPPATLPDMSSRIPKHFFTATSWGTYAAVRE